MKTSHLIAAAIAFPAIVNAEKMNIISIVVDDLGWNDVAFMGSKYHETPNIDKLAASGMHFTNGYATCAVCSPTRASLITGQYPSRIGITDWIHHAPIKDGKNPEGHHKLKNTNLELPINYEFLPFEKITIAETLKKAGYVTAHVGKWHLGPVKNERKNPGFKGSLPTDHGFDINLGGSGAGQPPSYFEDYRLPTMPADANGNTGDYLTDREAAECEKFIEANKDKPFFLNMWHYAVHTPLQAKKEYTEFFKKKGQVAGDNRKNAKYAAMVKSVDDAVGRIVAKVKELGLEDKTVIAFTSDNGGHVLWNISDLTPLRKGKGFPYEGGIRVPYIIKWPGVTKPGSVSGVRINSNDLYPTYCAAANCPLPKNYKLDGENLKSVLAGKSAKWVNRPLYWHFPHTWAGGLIKPYSTINDKDWKLIYHWIEDKVELYNLNNDLSESKDLAQSQPEKAIELKAKLMKWLKSSGAKTPNRLK